MKNYQKRALQLVLSRLEKGEKVELKSLWLKEILSRIISRIVAKKLGLTTSDIFVAIDHLRITDPNALDNGKVDVSLSLNVVVDKKQMERFIAEEVMK